MNQDQAFPPLSAPLVSRVPERLMDCPRTLSFPQGLIGFDQLKTFTLREFPDQIETAPLFFELSSVDEPLHFILIDAHQARLEFAEDDLIPFLAQLNLNLKDIDLYCIVATETKEGSSYIQANLRAPLFVEKETGVAFQFILTNSRYPISMVLA